MYRSIVWFRPEDLRLRDHAPLHAALGAGDAQLVFVVDDAYLRGCAGERHRARFLRESLGALQASVARRGGRLLCVRGPAERALPLLVEALGAQRVVAHGSARPDVRVALQQVRRALPVPLELFDGETLAPPGLVRTRRGRPYAVFTPFYRAFRARVAPAVPLPAPRRLSPPTDEPSLGRLGGQVVAEVSAPRGKGPAVGGEGAAWRRLARFVEDSLASYAERRDRLDLAGTSGLSADLARGTLSVRSVWHEASAGAPGAEPFLRQLVWREFAYQLVAEQLRVLREPFDRRFLDFPWVHDRGAFERWKAGETGYPLVDAAARELLETGRVHNRARMISASFLTKHLCVDYRWGEAHYLEHLVDGDPAQNNFGWQWSAGCGCDGQPYFRVFNPVSQGRRFDPAGDYVRRWLPALRGLSERHIHAPWTAPDGVLRAAGLRLGQDYPRPMVDHPTARGAYLARAKAHLRRASG